jgi:hypothetical protein
MSIPAIAGDPVNVVTARIVIGYAGKNATADCRPGKYEYPISDMPMYHPAS